MDIILPSSSETECGEEDYLSVTPRAPPSPVPIKRKRGCRDERRENKKPRIISLFANDEYQYSDILPDETRILILHPSKHRTDPIECVLVPVPFSQLGKGRFHYEALSYSWGDDEPVNTVSLQDYRLSSTTTTKENRQDVVHPRHRNVQELSWASFRIRSNLLSALQHLRHSEKKIHLWIDAVCINQDNDVEKSLQISKMAVVYSRAQNVRIWLGECDRVQRSDAGMEFVDNIVDLDLLDQLVTRHPIEYARNTATAGLWVAFANLLKRSWFRRRWVVQEVAFAKSASVQCGEIEKNWEDFGDAIELFIERIEQIRMFYNSTELAVQDPDAFKGAEALGARALVAVTGNIFRKSNIGYEFQRKLNIENLVSKLASFEVTDPRDAIFALSSLARDAPLELSPGQSEQLKQALRVDYGKHPLEVYTDFVRHSVQASKSLDIICRHWAFPISEDASLVQDWWFKAADSWQRGESDLNRTGYSLTQDSTSSLAIEPYRFGPRFNELSLDQLTDFLIAVDNIIRQLKQLFPYLKAAQTQFFTKRSTRTFNHEFVRPADLKEDAQLYGFVAQNLLNVRGMAMNFFIVKLFQGPRNRLDGPQNAHREGTEPRTVERYGPVSYLRDTLRPEGGGLAWTMRSSLALLWGICWVYHNYGYVQNTSAATRGRRSPFTVHKQSEKGLLESSMPSWIGLLKDSAFGPPHTNSGRDNADSLVGEPGKSTYNASNGLDPDVYFGQTDHQSVLEQASVSGLLATRPARPSGVSYSIASLLLNWKPDVRSNQMTPNRYDGRLFVKGVVLDRIVWTSSRVLEGVVPGEALQKLGWRLNDDLRHLPDQIWRILVADRGPDGRAAPGVYRRACLYCLQHANSQGDINTEELIRDHSQSSTVRDFLTRVRSVVWGMKFFAMKDKDTIFGLAPNPAQPGDLICILLGCSVPVVLRKVDEHAGFAQYKMIGGCYAHGYMDGEAITKMKEGELQSRVQVFVLR